MVSTNRRKGRTGVNRTETLSFIGGSREEKSETRNAKRRPYCATPPGARNINIAYPHWRVSDIASGVGGVLFTYNSTYLDTVPDRWLTACHGSLVYLYTVRGRQCTPLGKYLSLHRVRRAQTVMLHIL